MAKSNAEKLVDNVNALVSSCPKCILTKDFLRKHLYSLAYAGGRYLDSVIVDGMKFHRFHLRRSDTVVNVAY